MKLPTIFKKHKKLSYALIIIAMLIVAALLYFLTRGGTVEQILPEPVKYYSKLTSEEVDQSVAEGQILAVMIENSEAARPQSGLDSAGIVFETTTEAGITRYMAMYDANYPKDIAPVRSVRPAFVDWMMGFDAAIAHVGGSAPALEALRDRNAKDLDEFRYPDPYFRGNERPAPHNMHVKIPGLLDLMKDQGYTSSNVEGFPRANGTAVEQPDAADITVNFSINEFSTRYAYDASTNTYSRFLAGSPHIDALTDKPITVTNLIVLEMGTSIKAIGKGKATIFKDGTVTTGFWRQESFDKRIEFYKIVEGQEQEIPLNVGDSWIAAIPSTGSLTY